MRRETSFAASKIHEYVGSQGSEESRELIQFWNRILSELIFLDVRSIGSQFPGLNNFWLRIKKLNFCRFFFTKKKFLD